MHVDLLHVFLVAYMCVLHLYPLCTWISIH